MQVTVEREGHHWLVRRGSGTWRTYSERFAETMANDFRALPDDFPLKSQDWGADLMYEEEDGYGRGW